MRSSADNGSSWLPVRTLHDYTAHPNPQTQTLAPKPTPKPTPISGQVRTLHNYTDVVSGYVAPTVDHRSGAAFSSSIHPNPNPNPLPKPNPNPNPNQVPSFSSSMSITRR